MEKNIAALMRPDAYTLRVSPSIPVTGLTKARAPVSAPRSLPHGNKEYTYVSDFPDIIPGDYVVVDMSDELRVVEVVAVDKEVLIEPGSDLAYKWVVARVDMARHLANTSRNDRIANAVAAAGRTSMRRMFANQVLAGLEDEARSELLALTGGAPDAQS
jgi:hypothetical protein